MKDVMRIQPRSLSDNEQHMVNATKYWGLDFWEFLDGEVAPNLDSPDAERCLALAKTKLEEAVMWATKAITA